MTSNTLGVLLKLFALSALLSGAIKWGGPLLNLSDSNGSAVLIVASLPLAMALWLWQSSRNAES